MSDHEKPYIAVDLDGTLAYYYGWEGPDRIGAPIPVMLHRVYGWIDAGIRVKIFTARAAGNKPEYMEPIRNWLIEHGLGELEITCEKDFGCVCIWDDRCVRVVANEGQPCCVHAFQSGVPH